MHQVPSSACSSAAAQPRRRARAARTLAAAALTLAFAWGGSGIAVADALGDRHAEIQRALEVARGQMGQQTKDLDRAEAALEASSKQLEEARAGLEKMRADLTAARTLDAELATRLAQEQERLREAQEAADRARADVEAQHRLIAQAAREAYQGRPELAGISVLVGEKTPAELAQRLQWDTTIFTTTGQRMEQLRVLEQQLAQAQEHQARVEAQVAGDKARAAENVARIERLEADAVAQERDVAALVARDDGFRKAAEQALAADNRAYGKLLAEEAAIERQLAGRASDQLASGTSREDIARLVATGVASSDHASYPLVESGPQTLVSAQGFIRPVKATPGSPFGQRFHPILKYWRMHNGTDFGAACGVPLYAAQSGTVVKAGPQGGFGNYVVVDHGVVGGRSIMTGYAHMETVGVRAGQRVGMGQQIGTVGTTGLSTGCHLHLQVYSNGTPVDPLTYIP